MGLVFFRPVYVLVFLLSFGNEVFYIRAARCISIGFLERKRTAPEVRTFFWERPGKGNGGGWEGEEIAPPEPQNHLASIRK